MFMHGGIFHILFNMFALWMFGSLMERIWGPKRFLSFYLVCGLFAAIAQMISYAVAFWGLDHATLTAVEQIQYQDILTKSATVGASGAIMGVLAAYAYTFPNTELFIMPIPFPIKAKWAIIGIIGIDLFGGFANASNDNVAHFAHVGGALAGLAIVWYWNRNNKRQFF
jgi:membrane associated rhomboid family serine protease